MAGTLFVVPGALAILALSIIYVTLGHVPLIAGIFLGLKAAVMALVVEAVLRVGRRALRSTVARAVAAAAFLALFVFGLPFPIVVVAAGLFGFWWTRSGRGGFTAGPHGGSAADAPIRSSTTQRCIARNPAPAARYAFSRSGCRCGFCRWRSRR